MEQHTALRLIPHYGLTGRFDEALAQADLSWDRWLYTADPNPELAADAEIAALVHGARGDLRQFEEWRSRALRIAGVDAAVRSPALAAPDAFVNARVAVLTGRGADADRLIEAAFAPFAEQTWLPYAHAAGAELAVLVDLPDAATWLAAAEPAAAENDWAAACLARATARHTGDQELMAEAVARWERIGARFERAVTLLQLPRRFDEGLAELVALAAAIPVP